MKPIRFPGAPELPPPNGNGSRTPSGQDAQTQRSTGFVPRPGGEVVAQDVAIPSGVQDTTKKAVLWGAAALLIFLFFEGRG